MLRITWKDIEDFVVRYIFQICIIVLVSGGAFIFIASPYFYDNGSAKPTGISMMLPGDTNFARPQGTEVYCDTHALFRVDGLEDELLAVQVWYNGEYTGDGVTYMPIPIYGAGDYQILYGNFMFSFTRHDCG